MCAGAGTSVSSRLSVNSSNHSGKSWRKLSSANSLLRSGAGLEDVLDESCGGNVEDELVPELDDNPRTTKRYEVFRCCIKSSYLVWLGAASHRWSIHKYIRVLRRVFQVIELHACPCVIALSRRDKDRERILVLPRSSAILHWSLPPLWGWISAESPVLLSLNPFCSACASMLQSQPRILVPLECLKCAPALSMLR